MSQLIFLILRCRRCIVDVIMQHLHFSCFFMVFFRSSTKAPMTTSIKNQAVRKPCFLSWPSLFPCSFLRLQFFLAFIFRCWRLLFSPSMNAQSSEVTLASRSPTMRSAFPIYFSFNFWSWATCFYAFPILPSSCTYTPYTKMHWMIFGQWRSWNISAFFFARRMELQHWTLPRHDCIEVPIPWQHMTFLKGGILCRFGDWEAKWPKNI